MFAIIKKIDGKLTIIQEESMRELLFNLLWDTWNRLVDDIIEENNYKIIDTRSIVADYYLSPYGNDKYEIIRRDYRKRGGQICKSEDKEELIEILNELELQYTDFTYD